jgi:hypothetical protein
MKTSNTASRKDKYSSTSRANSSIQTGKENMLACNAPQKHGEREALIRTLASRLEFSVEKAGSRFTLLRTTDVVPPVCEVCLTLNEAEQLLQTWKLRGRGEDQQRLARLALC